MKTTTRRKGNVYTITTQDKNPNTGKCDVLSTVELVIGQQFGTDYWLRRDTDGFMTGTCSMPLPLVDEAKSYFHFCRLSNSREVLHPTSCPICTCWVPANEECPACADLAARRAIFRANFARIHGEEAAVRYIDNAA